MGAGTDGGPRDGVSPPLLSLLDHRLGLAGGGVISNPPPCSRIISQEPLRSCEKEPQLDVMKKVPRL